MTKNTLLTTLVVWGVPLVSAAPPARILIITGQSDTQFHDWRASTQFLSRVLGNTGRFDVRVAEEARGLTREALAQYDAVILNYLGPRWGPGPEAALDEFVRSGKGIVSFHGVTYGPLMGTAQRSGGGWERGEGWPEYPNLIGATWAPENIGHGPRHAFTVKIADRLHPITKGLDPAFTVNDELYHRMTLKPGVRVVATAFDDAARGGTGKEEPIAWTSSYGKGRVFHCSLGHDVNALYQPALMTLFARATEWAATGETTLESPVALNTTRKGALRVLVVTGGHSYDPSFYEVFTGWPDLEWSHATSQKEAFSKDMKKRWDVVVLYDMYNEIGDAEKNNLREYVEAGKGIVALHHSIVDYTSWPWWYEEVIGGKYFEKAVGDHPASQYKHDEPMVIRPVRGQENHPIVRGLGELVTVDECYRGMWHSPKITVLMETNHPLNDSPMVYLGPGAGTRAVYIQLGHDSFTHRHPGYRRLVHNAVVWAAGRD
jgi:type 1 glutamine amidotransferase